VLNYFDRISLVAYSSPLSMPRSPANPGDRTGSGKSGTFRSPTHPLAAARRCCANQTLHYKNAHMCWPALALTSQLR
jgi:hypothetical protein